MSSTQIGFDQFLLLLRVGMTVVLYLFILQVVLVARRDISVAATGAPVGKKTVIGHLVVVDSGQTPLVPGTRLDILPTMTLGRSPTSDVVLDSPVVSTEHTRIYFQNRSLWVEDLRSRNGTFVNDRPVAAPVAVRPNDIVRVGDVRFKLTT